VISNQHTLQGQHHLVGLLLGTHAIARRRKAYSAVAAADDDTPGSAVAAAADDDDTPGSAVAVAAAAAGADRAPGTRSARRSVGVGDGSLAGALTKMCLRYHISSFTVRGVSI
jgi:hypothetical protein